MLRAFAGGWNLPNTSSPWSHPPNQVSWSWLKSRLAPPWCQRRTRFSSANKKEICHCHEQYTLDPSESPEVVQWTRTKPCNAKLDELSRFIDDCPVETRVLFFHCHVCLPDVARTCYTSTLNITILDSTTKTEVYCFFWGELCRPSSIFINPLDFQINQLIGMAQLKCGRWTANIENHQAAVYSQYSVLCRFWVPSLSH